MSLRLATFNLFSGRSLGDGRCEPDRIADAVAILDADVLAVQEVDCGLPRSGGHDQAALVARAVGAVGYRFVPLVTGTPGAPGWARAPRCGWDCPGRAGPSYGIALASRRPVVAWHVLHFDPPPGRWPIVVPGGRRRVLWLADEPRAVIAAELADPPAVVAGTHLSFVPGVNALQLRRARGWLIGLAGSPPAGRDVVLMGDLNLPGRLPARFTGWRSLVTGPTFPAPAPRVQLDHVLAVGPLARDALAAHGRVIRLPVGDHCAVVADLEL